MLNSSHQKSGRQPLLSRMVHRPSGSLRCFSGAPTRSSLTACAIELNAKSQVSSPDDIPSLMLMHAILCSATAVLSILLFPKPDPNLQSNIPTQRIGYLSGPAYEMCSSSANFRFVSAVKDLAQKWQFCCMALVWGVAVGLTVGWYKLLLPEL